MSTSNPTLFLIDSIERINGHALRAYFWLAAVATAVSVALAVVGWQITGEQSRFVFTISTGLFTLVVGLPANNMFQRRERISAMRAYRLRLAMTGPDDVAVRAIDNDVRAIFAKLGGG